MLMDGDMQPANLQPGQQIVSGQQTPVAPQPSPQPAQAPKSIVADAEGSVSWSASEYVHHQKPKSWYVGLAAIATVTSLIMFFVLNDFFGPLVIIMMAIALWIFGSREPNMLDYRIDVSGITIGQKHHTFESFKSFAVMEDGGVVSVQLWPLKRFMAPISIYFAPESADKIIETFGMYLPHDEKKTDSIDRMSRMLRF